MDRRLRLTFSRAILQWLLEASAEVLIIANMMASSSSAYGSSFHDNGDGATTRRRFFTPPASARAHAMTATTATKTVHPPTVKKPK
jgi:hypothetical protein